MGPLVLTASSFARASFWPRPPYDSESDPRTSEVGTDLRAVRHRRHGPFGEIALPPELIRHWPAYGKPPVPAPRTSEVGTDLRAVRTADMALSEKSPYPRSSPENSKPVEQPQPSPENLPGRDRSPSGPAPQTRRFRRNHPTPGAHREMLSPRFSQRFNGMGRAGGAFFRESLVVRSVRVSSAGLIMTCSSLSPRLAKESATPSRVSQRNRSGSAGQAGSP